MGVFQVKPWIDAGGKSLLLCYLVGVFSSLMSQTY